MLSKKSLNKHFLLACCCFFVMSSNILSQDDIWTRKTPMPTARVLSAACEVNGIIYVIGGVTKRSWNDYIPAVSTVEAYNPKTDTWTTKKDMPTPRHSLATCSLNGKIYAIGGSDSPSRPGDAHNTVEEYDPMTDSWQSKTRMPTKRAYLAACSVERKIYAFGGKDGNNVARPEVEAYDPTTDTWSTKAGMLTARNYLAACLADGKIYAIGGAIGASDVERPNNEVYEPVTDRWFKQKDMPTARLGLSASSVNGKVYAIGGSDATFYAPAFNTVERYDPATDRWWRIINMPTPRVWHTSCAVDGKIYVFGGTTDGNITGTVATVEVYDPSIDLIGLLDYVNVNKKYAEAGSDSVCINVKLNNPTGITIFAEIEAPDQTPVDSLQLYDDGNHNDGNAGDSLYANIWPVLSAEERRYYVDLQVTRVDTDTVFQHINNVVLFTTIGPVVLDSYNFHSFDTEPNPGDQLIFKLTLKNNGLSATAKNVKADLICLDSLATVSRSSQTFGDIVPGTEISHKNWYMIDISKDCGDSTEIHFRVDIASNGYTFWSDMFSITVVIPTEIANAKENIPLEFALFQNYPNPFNSATNIAFSLPKREFVTLEVLNMLGQTITTLESDFLAAGSYTYTWDAGDGPSGIYFYRLKTANFSQTCKMLLVR